MTHDILLTPATEIAARLHKRDLSARELLKLTLERIEHQNPHINAVIAMDPEAAWQQADRSDANLKSGQAGPLEGLVVTIKDSIDVAGLPTTSGAPLYQDRIAQKDAAAIARLRRDGAVFLGKTNVPILTGDFQSFNTLFGTTNNPWDTERSPGGSSGGAAAAVATGMSTFEIGSDFAGSIRWPAHACGIFGHRPTYGLVSSRGHVPPPPGAGFEPEFSTLGPLARSASDLALILDRIHGPVTLDGLRPELSRPSFDDPAHLRIAVWADDADAPVDGEVASAVREAARQLQGAGAQVDDNARPAFTLAEELETFSLFNHAIIAAGFPEEVRKRLASRADSFSSDDRSHQALQARGAKLDAISWGRLQERKAFFISAWEAFFRDFDVLICPPAPVAAIPHDHTSSFHSRTLEVNGDKQPYFDFLHWASLASLSGLPASVAPISQTADSLPLGVQIISAPGHDLTTIAVAALLEKIGPGFLPPPI